MKHSRRIGPPFSIIGETMVRQSFEQARHTLRSSPKPEPESNPTPADWTWLARIQDLLEYAFTTGDWQGAKREIDVLKRRAQIHIVVEQAGEE